jgi:patatin-like phospholipase/acyl hydrolase
MRVLSLDGGGFLGIASAAFLDALESHFTTTCHDRFDLFCGTSTGAVIALALASGKSASEVVTLYETFGPRVFPRARTPLGGHLRFLRGVFWPRYSSRELRACLDDVFGNDTLGSIHASGKSVLIPAFNLSGGCPCVFKTDHSGGLSRDNGRRIVDVAMASAAAPFYLPTVTLESPKGDVVETFCDGGLFANHPALLGFTEAVADLGASPETVELLSVATPRSNTAEYETNMSRVRRSNARGALGWSSPEPAHLINLAIDSTGQVAHQTVKRLAKAVGARYERIDLEKPPGVALDNASVRACKDLVRIGVHKAQLGDVRKTLAAFFQRGGRE